VVGQNLLYLKSVALARPLWRAEVRCFDVRNLRGLAVEIIALFDGFVKQSAAKWSAAGTLLPSAQGHTLGVVTGIVDVQPLGLRYGQQAGVGGDKR
jgi:hypothetical protein